MKKITTYLMIMTVLSLVFTSCAKDDLKTLGGTHSPIGDKGTTFAVVGLPSGIGNVSAEISDLNDKGVSTLTIFAEVTNPSLLAIVSQIDRYDDNATIQKASGEFKITSEGAQSIYEDGSCVLVKYDAKVGDVYTAKHDGMALRREVTAVSTQDEYYWNGMLLKTITVRETGRNIPGLASVDHVYNHRFGLVGATVYFEDGSSESVNVISSVFN